MGRGTWSWIAVVVAVFVAVGVWSLSGGDRGAAELVREEVEPDEEVAARTLTHAAVDVEERKSARPVPQVVESADAPPVEVVVDDAFDPDERVTVALRVVDEAGNGVPTAEVTIGGLRSTASPGNWYAYRDGPVGTTGPDGRLVLEAKAWVNPEGRTRGVDVRVRHPDFVPFRDGSLALRAGETTITLLRGATLVVTGWIGEPGNVVTDVAPLVDRRARLTEESWFHLGDGRLVTTQLAPGPHVLVATHVDADGRAWSSEGRDFELAADGWTELSVELLAHERLVGELGPEVPRPVRNGNVLLVVRTGSPNGREPAFSRNLETAVAADGSFVFESVPRGGRGFLIALADGWITEKKRVESFEEMGVHRSVDEEEDDPNLPEIAREMKARARAMMDERIEQRIAAGEMPWSHQPPRVTIVPDGPPVVLDMVPTGILEVVVTDPEGAPIPGARVATSPNYSLMGVGSSVLPWRTWWAEADANGVARVEDLPPESLLPAHVAAPGFEAVRTPLVQGTESAIRSGETTRLTVQLEPAGG